MAFARTFVLGFGLQVGCTVAYCLWPEIDNVTSFGICAGAGMMAFAVIMQGRRP